MHAFELVELAALVAAHTATFLRLTKDVSQPELARYWTASKCRHDRWQLALSDLKGSRSSLIGPRGGMHGFARALFDEIFTGEILTRVWTGVLAAHDTIRRTDHAEPIARSVLAGHLEVRCRALTLLSTSRELPLGDIANLDRQRRLCERWTDLLLAEIATPIDGCGLAHDSARMLDFAADVPRSVGPAFLNARRALVFAAVRAAFRQPATLPTLNDDLNTQIAAGVLGCFQPELFDGSGVMRSAWIARLLAVADDAQTMVEDYLGTTEAANDRNLGRRLRRF